VSDDEGDDGVRVWLVERSVSARDVVTLVYATPDGARAWRRQLAATALDGDGVPAARTVAGADLEAVAGADRERYAAEAARVRERHDPADRL
jgi:hypothetical protein